MSLKTHNESQACAVQKLIDDQRWYISEELGYDCTTTASGLCLLNQKVADIITDGFGQYMAELPETQEITSTKE